MNENLETMTNQELKAYIKANCHDELICHEVIQILMNRQSENTTQYPYNLSDEDMEKVFQGKLQSN